MHFSAFWRPITSFIAIHNSKVFNRSRGGPKEAPKESKGPKEAPKPLSLRISRGGLKTK